MDLPPFITKLPELDLPFPPSIVRSHAMRTADALLVFFDFLQDADIPAHSHGAQWGTVLEGRVELSMDGRTTVAERGMSYSIPAGAVHAVRVAAGTKAIDVFEEPQRYRLR
jgi:quercetin dioxygenase-like cupin family protein